MPIACRYHANGMSVTWGYSVICGVCAGLDTRPSPNCVSSVTMDLLHTFLVFLHLLGAAALVGGWLATFKTPTVGVFQFAGAWVQLVTGLLLVGLAEMGDGHVNNVKIAVKLVILIGVLVAAIIGRKKVKKGEAVPTGIAHAVGGLAFVNVALAVFW